MSVPKVVSGTSSQGRLPPVIPPESQETQKAAAVGKTYFCNFCHQEGAEELCGRCNFVNHWPNRAPILQHENQQDVVAYSSGFFNEEEMRALVMLEDPPELQQIHRERLEECIAHQNYKGILKSIWVGRDFDAILKILLPYAEAGHPILMFEYSRTLCRKMDTDCSYPAEVVLQALKWYFLGAYCTTMDAACSNDRSVGAASGMLLESYAPFKIVPQEHLLIEPKGFRKEVFQSWTPRENLPSPEWVIYHGMACFRGGNSLKPPGEWLAARQEKYQEMLRQFPD